MLNNCSIFQKKSEEYEKIKADRAAQGLPELLSDDAAMPLNGAKKKKWKNNVSKLRTNLHCYNVERTSIFDILTRNKIYIFAV